MKYEDVTADTSDKTRSHKNLLELARRSAYSADVYKSLEIFFLNQGYRDDADTAFIAGQTRERKENLSGLVWFGSWALYLLVGYGRHPVYAGGLCVIMVALGCILFAKDKMQLQVKQEKGDPKRI